MMMTELQGQHLDQWITDVRADSLPALHSFTNGFCKDRDAVLAVLPSPTAATPSRAKPARSSTSSDSFGRSNLDLLRNGTVELTHITEGAHSPQKCSRAEIRDRKPFRTGEFT
jgi:hypothetical protein